MRSNSPRVEVRFPTEYLAQAMRRNDAVTDEFGSAPRLSQKIANRVGAVLDSSTSDLPPTLETLAEFSGMSPRSLQRRLNDDGQTYFEVIGRWRFRRALKLISNPDFKVGEIAAHVRYSHTAMSPILAARSSDRPA